MTAQDYFNEIFGEMKDVNAFNQRDMVKFAEAYHATKDIQRDILGDMHLLDDVIHEKKVFKQGSVWVTMY